MTFTRRFAFLVVCFLVGCTVAVRSEPRRGAVPYDLGVSIVGSPEPVGHDEVLSLAILVVNNGAGIADPVLVQTTTPEETTFESATSTIGIVRHPEIGGTGTVEITARSLEAGDAVLLRLNVRVVADPGSTIRALATASGPDDAGSDADPNDNMGRTAVPVRIDGAIVNLGVAIAPVGVIAGSGAPFGFDLVVTNHATDATAVGVVVRTAVPGGTTFSTALASGIVTPPAIGSRGDVLIEFGTMESGETELIHVTVNVTASAGHRVDMTASVASSATDPESSDNVDTASLLIVESSTYRLDWDPPSAVDGALARPLHLVATEVASADAVESEAQRGALIGYNVYRAARPDVLPSAGNFFGFVSVASTTSTVLASPAGTFFVVTALYGDGESGASNEASADVLAAHLTKVKVTDAKIVGNGTGFSATVDVFVDGIPFVMEAQRKRSGARFVQKGPLFTGATIGGYLASHPVVLITFRNENGGVAAYRHPQ